MNINIESPPCSPSEPNPNPQPNTVDELTRVKIFLGIQAFFLVVSVFTGGFNFKLWSMLDTALMIQSIGVTALVVVLEEARHRPLHQAEFLEVARDRRLRRVDATAAEPLLQHILAGDPLAVDPARASDFAKDLTDKLNEQAAGARLGVPEIECRTMTMFHLTAPATATISKADIRTNEIRRMHRGERVGLLTVLLATSARLVLVAARSV